jgi:uncharacterized protein YbjT (DUF2867 family)
MKIIITGSLGHISKPLARELVQQGHEVTVISSSAEKKGTIEELGATAAIGSVEDVSFLAATFAGADAVYCMEPPPSFSNKDLDIMEHTRKQGENYAQAILKAGVKRVVHLSSIGAHTDKGNGMLAFHYYVEQILNRLPADVAITFMRPVGFYYNMFSFIQTIKTQGSIISNYGGDLLEPWVSPIDIAAAIAKEIVTPLEGRKVIYVASEEITPNQLAGVLGAAIGKPDLQWIVIPDEQLLNGMVAGGMNPALAKGFVEMNAGRRSGVLYEDYLRNRPELGKVKIKDFAKEFAAAYNA